MFYPFVMNLMQLRLTGDRRDDVADFALCVERDKNWPVFCDDREKLRSYLQQQGAGPLTMSGFEQGYEEYLGIVGHRLG